MVFFILQVQNVKTQNVKRDVFGLCLSSAGDLTHSNVSVSLFLSYLTQMLLLQALLQDARNFNISMVDWWWGVLCVVESFVVVRMMR